MGAPEGVGGGGGEESVVNLLSAKKFFIAAMLLRDEDEKGTELYFFIPSSLILWIIPLKAARGHDRKVQLCHKNPSDVNDTSELHIKKI